MCICLYNSGHQCLRNWPDYLGFYFVFIHARSSVHLDHVILADISWQTLFWRRIDEYRFYIPPSHDMWVESFLFLFFTPSLFNDGIVSYNSSPASLQIPPLALPKGRPGWGACFFWEIIVTYLTNAESTSLVRLNRRSSSLNRKSYDLTLSNSTSFYSYTFQWTTHSCMYHLLHCNYIYFLNGED